MIDVLIIEDEQISRRLLERTLLENFPDIRVVGATSSVAQSVRWLEDPSNHADLIFMDVELSDGKCFEIFRRVEVKARVVMTTAYDTYAVKAFEVNSVDYLLKPVDLDSLRRAVQRCRDYMGQDRASSSHRDAIDVQKLLSSLESHRSPYKERYLVHLNDRIVPVRTCDVSMFFSHSKDNHIITRDGTVYVLDSTLDTIASEVDPDCFFRISRGCILSKDSVQSVVKVMGGRLEVKVAGLDHGSPTFKRYGPDLVVSKSRVEDFLKWLEN